MAMKLTYDHPDFPKDTEFELPHLGLFKNGEATEVTKEMQDSFKAATDQTVHQYYDGHDMFKVEGSTPAKEDGGK